MTSANPPLSPLGRWYALLAGIATVAALQASLFPRWPQAPQLPANLVLHALKQGGLRPETLKPGAAEERGDRSLELSISPPLVFRLPGGEELRLVRGAFRQRYSVQVAGIAAKSPGLALSNRRLFPGPPPSAEGRVKDHPARQTCFVPQALTPKAFGVTSDQILTWVDVASAGRPNDLRRLIGLQPNRDYSCILISLRSGDDSPVSENLWQRILAALPAGLMASNGRV
jgi:hypothetical protein